MPIAASPHPSATPTVAFRLVDSLMKRYQLSKASALMIVNLERQQLKKNSNHDNNGIQLQALEEECINICEHRRRASGAFFSSPAAIVLLEAANLLEEVSEHDDICSETTTCTSENDAYEEQIVDRGYGDDTKVTSTTAVSASASSNELWERSATNMMSCWKDDAPNERVRLEHGSDHAESSDDDVDPEERRDSFMSLPSLCLATRSPLVTVRSSSLRASGGVSELASLVEAEEGFEHSSGAEEVLNPDQRTLSATGSWLQQIDQTFANRTGIRLTNQKEGFDTPSREADPNLIVVEDDNAAQLSELAVPIVFQVSTGDVAIQNQDSVTSLLTSDWSVEPARLADQSGGACSPVPPKLPMRRESDNSVQTIPRMHSSVFSTFAAGAPVVEQETDSPRQPQRRESTADNNAQFDSCPAAAKTTGASLTAPELPQRRESADSEMVLLSRTEAAASTRIVSSISAASNCARRTSRGPQIPQRRESDKSEVSSVTASSITSSSNASDDVPFIFASSTLGAVTAANSSLGRLPPTMPQRRESNNNNHYAELPIMPQRRDSSHSQQSSIGIPSTGETAICGSTSLEAKAGTSPVIKIVGATTGSGDPLKRAPQRRDSSHRPPSQVMPTRW